MTTSKAKKSWHGINAMDVLISLLFIGFTITFLTLFYTFHNNMVECDNDLYKEAYIAANTSDDAAKLLKQKIKDGKLSISEAQDVINSVSWKTMMDNKE